jgi:hypothetical protein
MMTMNGVSTTGKNMFQAEHCTIARRRVVQWDYRDTNDELHSGIASSMEAAKIAAAKFGYQE